MGKKEKSQAAKQKFFLRIAIAASKARQHCLSSKGHTHKMAQDGSTWSRVQLETAFEQTIASFDIESKGLKS